MVENSSSQPIIGQSGAVFKPKNFSKSEKNNDMYRLKCQAFARQTTGIAIQSPKTAKQLVIQLFNSYF